MPIPDRVPQTRTEFERGVEVEIVRAHRLAHPLGLALVAIDRFDTITRQGGAEAEQAATAATVHIILSSIRLYDYFGIWDEGTFAVLFPETTEAGVLAAARRLVVTVRQGALAAGSPIPLTVSIGVATAGSSRQEQLSTLVAAAQRALDRAQRSSGNRAELEAPEAGASAA